MHDLVGDRQLVIKAIEVANRGVDVHRLDRIAAGKVHAVEVLREPDEILVGLAGAGFAAFVEIGIVRRRGDVAEDDVVAADAQLPFGIARRDGELARRHADIFHDHVAAHAHRLAVDAGAGLAQDFNRLGIEHDDPDFLQDRHCTVMDGKHALRANRFGRPVDVDRTRPGKLRDCGALAALVSRAAARAAPAAFRGCRVISFHGFQSRSSMPA